MFAPYVQILFRELFFIFQIAIDIFLICSLVSLVTHLASPICQQIHQDQSTSCDPSKIKLVDQMH